MSSECSRSSTARVKKPAELWTVQDSTKKAEIIDGLQFAMQNVPISFCDNVAACYQMQSLDFVIVKNITMSTKKMSYMIGYVHEPYFKQMTVREILERPLYFTSHFEKMVTAKVQRQNSLLMQYWSEGQNEVRVKYLT